MAPVPGAPPHLGMTQPVEVTWQETCDHRYQEGPGVDSTLQCACGPFAIGRCLMCQTPVDGEHSALRDGRLLCLEHLAEDDRQKTAAEQRAAEEQRAADAAARKKKRSSDQGRVISAVQRRKHPVERVIAAKLAATKFLLTGDSDLAKRVQTMLPDLKNELYDASPRWGIGGWKVRYPAVGSWLVGQVPPTTWVKVGGLFGKRIPAWNIGQRAQPMGNGALERQTYASVVFLSNGQVQGEYGLGAFDDSYLADLASLLHIAF